MRRLREHPSAADEVPLPQWGRLRYEDTVFLDTTPFPIGKAKRRRLRRPKRKPTPPRCARQPLPREGARVDTPSFLWKEVPRRGGGWVRKGVYEKIRSTASARRHFPITACMLISVVQSRSLHFGRDDDTGETAFPFTTFCVMG